MKQVEWVVDFDSKVGVGKFNDRGVFCSPERKYNFNYNGDN